MYLVFNAGRKFREYMNSDKFIDFIKEKTGYSRDDIRHIAIIGFTDYVNKQLSVELEVVTNLFDSLTVYVPIEEDGTPILQSYFNKYLFNSKSH